MGTFHKGCPLVRLYRGDDKSGGDFALTVAQLAPLKSGDPYLYETLVKLVSAVNAASQNAGVDPATPSPAPAPIASLQVQAANGWFDLAITDPAISRPGLCYFAESDVTASFNSPRVYFLGPSRNLYVQLGLCCIAMPNERADWSDFI